MIKTFHVATNAKVADVFTKALGSNSFTRLIGKLDLKDIFMPKQLQTKALLQVPDLPVQDLRGSVKIEEGKNSGMSKVKKKITRKGSKGVHMSEKEEKGSWKQLSSNKEAKCQNVICCIDKFVS